MKNFKSGVSWIDRLLDNGHIVIIDHSNYDNALNWAGKNIENFKWLSMTKIPKYHFYFENATDAMLFKLKWG